MNGKFIVYALIVAFLGTSATWIKMLGGPGTSGGGSSWSSSSRGSSWGGGGHK